MSEVDNINAAKSFFNAWNAGDLSKAYPYHAEGYMAESPGTPGPMNNTQELAYNQSFLTAFPGSQFELVHTIVQGDYVVLNWKISGTHAGPLQTPSGGVIPPTGKLVKVVGSTTAQVKNGKVLHSWNFWDMAGFLIQLGLMPPM